MTKKPSPSSAPSSSPARTDWIKIIGEAGLILALVTAWLYLAGWRFAYNYFDAFGVGISAVEIKREFILTYGFWVLCEFTWWVLSTALVLLGLIWLWRWSNKGRDPMIIAAITIVAIVTFFFFGHWMGGLAGQQRFDGLRAKGFPGFNSVRVWVTAKDVEDLGSLTPLLKSLASPNACFKKLYADSKHLYVFDPVADEPNLPITVTKIPLSAVRMTRIQESSNNCGL
jgi:hypothetical protein